MDLEEKKVPEETAAEAEKAPAQEFAEAEKEVAAETISAQGIVGDSFDHIPEAEETAEVPEELAGEESVRIQYGFTADEVKKALQIFQKNTIYRKNIIYSLIIAILFALYLFQMVYTRNMSKFNTFMCVAILLALAFIWYFPLTHIRGVVKTVANMEYKEEFILKVYETAIQTGEGEGQAVYRYQDGKIRAWETNDMFVLGYGKERVFAIPKRCLSGGEAEVETVSRLLKNGLGTGYSRLADK